MIEIKNVTKKFGSFTAIENLSLSVPKGSIYGLVGYNGAGKTTLLKTVAGVYRANAGEVRLDNELIFENEKMKQKTFYVPDEIYFQPYSTMEKMVRFYRGYYPKFSLETFKRLSKLFGLDTGKRLNGFSKGMQRQAELILGISTLPEFLLLDESFDGLDPQKRALIKDLLNEYMLEKDISILISSHNLHELEDLCDYVGIINGKKIVLDGSIEELSDGKLKYRIVFDRPVTKEDFKEVEFKRFHQDGSIITLTALGDTQKAESKIKELSPVLIERTKLTLEELFLDEMEGMDNDITKIFG